MDERKSENYILIGINAGGITIQNSLVPITMNIMIL